MSAENATIEADPHMRVRLDVSYDGTDFAGWARQRDVRTVQGVLEQTVALVLRLPSVALTVAGRTDAGVHASGQVAHCDLPSALAQSSERGLPSVPSGLVRRLAVALPPDVRVTAARVVPDDFDARFSALWRRYEYRLWDGDSGVPPMRRRDVVGVPGSLDDAAMAEAAAPLLGLQNFAAFCKRREGATTVRTLHRLDVERDGPLVVCTVVADAFCHSMVRSLVGALLAVGAGRREVTWPASMLSSDERANDVTVAPAHGLTLVEVGYPPDEELAVRAAVTRARRPSLG